MPPFVDTILRHPAWGTNMRCFGRPGFSFPEMRELVHLPVDQAHIPKLKSYGFSFEGNLGENNSIYIDRFQDAHDLTIRLRDCSGTTIVFGKGESISGRLAFNGENSFFVSAGFGQMGGRSNVSVTLTAGSAAYFGKGCTSVQSNWIIEGPGRSVVVGDDLMASWGVSVRNYDSHALIDLSSAEIVNPALNLIIGPHCWIGQDSKILRGIAIGRSVVIGAGAILVADVEDFCVVAGVPAKVLRQGVTWSRSPSPTPAMIATAIDRWKLPSSPELRAKDDTVI